MSSHPRTDPSENDIDVKTRLKALTSEEFSVLQEAQKYREFAASVRSGGWVNLFLGLLNIWLGTACCTMTLVHPLQIVGGLVLIVVSLWAILAPSLRVVLTFSILLLVFGIVNIGISSFNSLLPVPGILGSVQLWWAYRSYRDYRIRKADPPAKPSLELLRLCKATRKAINKAEFVSDADIIDFMLERYVWRG